MFHGCGHIDASGSHFSNVGRDQTNVGRDQHIQTINLSIAETASHETVQHVLRSLPQQTPFSSSTAVFTSHHNRSTCDVASNLIVEITRLLDDLTKFSVDYRYMQELFKPLHKTLFLTGLAIQAYEYTPLGPNLVASIRPEVEQCCILLQDILDSIDRYRIILYSTPIRDLWPRVLWSGSKVHELTWKLSARQRSLGQFLVSLNS
jgi:hypothetical protein